MQRNEDCTKIRHQECIKDSFLLNFYSPSANFDERKKLSVKLAVLHSAAKDLLENWSQPFENQR